MDKGTVVMLVVYTGFLGTMEKIMDIWRLPFFTGGLLADAYFLFYFFCYFYYVSLKEMLFKRRPRCRIVLQFASTGG